MSRFASQRRVLLGVAAGLLIGAAVLIPGTARSADPPYDAELVRLAEVLGSLHYLAGLCGDVGPSWRGEMEDLLDAERPDGPRRARLIDRFNLGYSSFASVYRTCTAAARLALRRYRDEGAGLAREMVDRWAAEAAGQEPGPEAGGAR